MEKEKGTNRGALRPREPHPAAHTALTYIRSVPVTELALWLESFSSSSIEGNRLAEICGETLRRLMRGAPVSDRYLLGLAWTMRYGDKA